MRHLRQIMLEELRRRNYAESDVPAYNHSLYHQQLKRKHTHSKSHLANDNDHLIQIQIP